MLRPKSTVTSCHPKSAARASNCMEWPRFGSRRRRGGTRDDLPHHAVARHSLLPRCWNSFMYDSDSFNNYGGHYDPVFLSFLKFIIQYLSSSIFHHPNYGDLPANRGWPGKYLRTCWACLQIRIGLKTDAVIITTYPSVSEFSSIPQCLKTFYWLLGRFHLHIQQSIFIYLYQSTVAIPFQSSEGMAWNSPSDTCFIWTVARPLNSLCLYWMFGSCLNWGCFAKLQPVKDTDLKESADFQIVARCVSSCFNALHFLDLLRREQWCHTFGWYATCSGRPQGALGLSLQMPTNKWHMMTFVPLSKDKMRGSC